jgi:O-antigen ligase
VIVALVWPAPIIDGIVGWRGIMPHKNSFAALAVLATTFFLIVTLRRGVHPIWGATLATLSLLAVAQARSRTSFAALVGSLLASAYLAGAWMMRSPTRVVLQRLALGLVLGVLLIPFVVVLLANLVGDEALLNGRARLWGAVVTILRERPATGYGYATVWGRRDATLLPHIPATARLGATNAHNSVLNVASELGIPAAIVACIYLFRGLFNAGRLYQREPSTFSFCAFVFLVGFALLGFGEAHLLQIHSVFWLLFVAVTVTVQRTLTDR